MRQMSTRELRRMAEREQKRQQRQSAVDAWFRLTPEERQQRMKDNAAFQRIQRNGITVEDLHSAETAAFEKGLKAGEDSMLRACFAAFCMSLHDLHGFGARRCARVLNDIYDRMWQQISTKEAIDEVFSRMGLKLTFSGDVTQEFVEVDE